MLGVELSVDAPPDCAWKICTPTQAFNCLLSSNIFASSICLAMFDDHHLEGLVQEKSRRSSRPCCTLAGSRDRNQSSWSFFGDAKGVLRARLRKRKRLSCPTWRHPCNTWIQCGSVSRHCTFKAWSALWWTWLIKPVVWRIHRSQERPFQGSGLKNSCWPMLCRAL